MATKQSTGLTAKSGREPWASPAVEGDVKPHGGGGGPSSDNPHLPGLQGSGHMGPIDGVWTDAMAIHIGQDIADPPPFSSPRSNSSSTVPWMASRWEERILAAPNSMGDVAVVATGVHHPVLLALADPGLG